MRPSACSVVLLAALVGCSHGKSPTAPDGGAPLQSGGALDLRSGPTLSSSTLSAGQTLQADATLTNSGPAAVSVQAIALVLVAPGGDASGAPHLTLSGALDATSFPAGADVSLHGARTFQANDPAGNWQVRPAYQDASGQWRYLAGAPLSLGVPAPPPSGANITVDATHVLRTLPATFHGINDVGFWDPVQGSAASRTALSRTPIKLFRFAGGDPADWYDWQCPYWDGSSCPTTPNGNSWSSTSTADLWAYAEPLGGTLLLQTNFQGNVPNPPGQSYAVNSGENAAAWATAVKNGGMRAQFEIGNEEDIHMQSQHDANFQPYIDAFNQQAAAIHGVDAHLQVFGPAGTNEWYWWGEDSLGMFLAQTGNLHGSGQVDGVSLHFYRGSSWSDSAGTAQYWLSSGGPWAFIQQSIAANDTRSLPVYISEWHVGPATGDWNASMQNALLSADLIGAFAVSGVAGYQYFCTHGANLGSNAYGLLYGSGDTRPADSPTPTYYALALLSLLGDAVLPVTQTFSAADTVSSYATRRPDGSVQVLAINKSASSQTLAIGFSGYVPTGKQVTVSRVQPQGDLTAKDALYNGVPNPDPAAALPAGEVRTCAGTTFSDLLPAYSIAIYAFAP